MVLRFFSSKEPLFYLFGFVKYSGIFHMKPGKEALNRFAFRGQDKEPDDNKKYPLKDRKEKADYTKDKK